MSPLHTWAMASLVPLAHTGHWLWVLYLPPVLIVIGSLLLTKLRDRRSPRGDSSASDGARNGPG